MKSLFDRYLLKIAGPMAIVSFLLFGVGAAAAWIIHNQQVANSNLLSNEVKEILEIYDFYRGMRDVRQKIRGRSSGEDPRSWSQVSALRDKTALHLSRVRFATGGEERELVQKILEGYQTFWDRFDAIESAEFQGDRDAALGELIDYNGMKEVLGPTERFMRLSGETALAASDTNKGNAVQLWRGFMLLGICGGVGGLLGGLALARAIRRSIVQLEVSVRSTQGKLVTLGGPVSITQTGGLHELEEGLERIRGQIAELVERVQRSETELLRNEQLAAVGQLAAGIAHELRNPLMPIKMLVQAAIERDDERGLHGRQLRVVEEEIARLERSIEVFLDFARPVSLDMSSFDLATVVQQTLVLVEGRADKQEIHLRRRWTDESLMMVADVNQVRQVLLNLLLNAMDAMPDGGDITVTVRRLAAAEVPEAARSIAWCEIRVADTGLGLGNDVAGRVFEPFVTSKETGTGLGLSICKRIVQAHGGEITAHNLPTQGAEFTIRLPCLPATVAEPNDTRLIEVPLGELESHA
ncbi:MAG: hypothetical protein JSS02_22050 [Planctomycetes bacterium]|nr:hypothetical protein [Planctomycetota bacterium]